VTFVWLAAMATVIFRSELAILFGLLVFQELLRRKITIGSVLKYGIPAGIVSLGEYLMLLLLVVHKVYYRPNSTGRLSLLEEMVMAGR